MEQHNMSLWDREILKVELQIQMNLGLRSQNKVN